MAYSAKDGSQYTNRIGAVRRDASLDNAKASARQPSGQSSQQGGQSQGGIEDDPEAMQAVDLLKQKGYTAEDVARAMDDDGGESDDSQSGQGGSASMSSSGAGSFQIPGM